MLVGHLSACLPMIVAIVGGFAEDSALLSSREERSYRLDAIISPKSTKLRKVERLPNFFLQVEDGDADDTVADPVFVWPCAETNQRAATVSILQDAA
jgi:hypothetical protein